MKFPYFRTYPDWLTRAGYEVTRGIRQGTFVDKPVFFGSLTLMLVGLVPFVFSIPTPITLFFALLFSVGTVNITRSWRRNHKLWYESTVTSKYEVDHWETHDFCALGLSEYVVDAAVIFTYVWYVF